MAYADPGQASYDQASYSQSSYDQSSYDQSAQTAAANYDHTGQQQPAVREDIQQFFKRYPADERAQQFLMSCSEDIIQRVLGNFRPRTEGDADYSGLITSYVRKIRNSAGYGPGLPGVPAPAANGAYAQQAQWEQPMQQPMQQPLPQEDEDDDPLLKEELANFVTKYPLDEGAFNHLMRLPPEVQVRIINEFRPRSLGDADYSALLMTYAKRCMDDHHGIKGGGKGKGKKGHQADPWQMQQMQAEPEMPVGPPSAAEIEDFCRRYPVDARAYDYFICAPPAVQQKVLREFRPKTEGESDYSSLLTTFTKRVKAGTFKGDSALYKGGGKGAPDAYSAPAPGGYSAAPASDYTAAAPTAADYEAFRTRFPMDDRAYEYLTSCSAEVGSRVIRTFLPHRLDDADFSAAVTAYVKSCRRVLDQPGGLPAMYGAAPPMGKGQPRPMQPQTAAGAGGAPQGGSPYNLTGEQEVVMQQFLARYPVDERAWDFLATCGPTVFDRVMSEFRPRTEGDSDYSALVMSFTKRIRDQERGGGKGGCGGGGAYANSGPYQGHLDAYNHAVGGAEYAAYGGGGGGYGGADGGASGATAGNDEWGPAWKRPRFDQAAPVEHTLT